MKAWKCCLALVLSLMIFTTSVNISEAAGTYDIENFIWKADEAEIVAEFYGLDKKEIDVLKNNAINGGREYTLFAPYDNGTGGKRDLIAVDYLNKKVYAKALYTEGLAWLPTTAVLSAEGEEKETIVLTAGVCYYNEVEYYASEAFTYDGYSYTVEVNYQLYVEVAPTEQIRILQIPVVLTQTAVNLETNLEGVCSELENLGDMIPALNELLAFEFPVEEIVENKETGEKEKIESTEPAFDPEEDADIIETIETLYQEYTENEGLILYNLSEEYRRLGGKNILAYTFSKGAQIQQESAALYEKVSILKDSTRLRNVCKELYTEAPDLYAQLKNLQRTLRNLRGSAADSSELEGLRDTANWTILDENIKAQIFAESYTEEDFAALESAVYALRNYEPEVPEMKTETLVAAEIRVGCDITMYDISVSMNAMAVSGVLEDSGVYELEVFGTTITLLEGATADEIKTAIEQTGIESMALSAWNSVNSIYEIDTRYYNRKESGIPTTLYDNAACEISYSPKFYKVKTNFRGNAELPFGFQFELPVSSDEEISYEYIVETESGGKVSYNEGMTFKVTQHVTITQLEGAEKVEYRLYDFLINDKQYTMSREAKQVLANTAVDSPTLKIRMPDGRTVGDIIEENGAYRIEAQDYSAGILGMTWEPDTVYLMNNNEILFEVPFEGNTATWAVEGFTHVNVTYRLKIEKVSAGLMNRPVDETGDVLYALNLPHELVTHTVKQNQLLSTGEEISAKILYEELAAISSLINADNFALLASCMESDEEKDALLRLQGSDNQIIKGQNGQSLGYGAWNTANNELALYTYLKLCADSNWSLAKYYKQGLYDKVAEQAAVVADCLEVIVAAPKFLNLVNGIEKLKEKKDQIVEMLPKLRQLSEEIDGAHEAILMGDESYEELIELLLTMEGKTAPVDSSNGIYAYTTIRRNGSDTGSLTLSVQVGSKLAQTKEISYVTADGIHILTDTEADQIVQYIAELEELCGMTAEEKQYYDLVATAIPQAGAVLGKNEVISLTYLPKEYTVTIKDVPEYQATFKYKSDYVIALPPYSEKDPEATKYYRYWIDPETPVKAENVSGGYYAFSKEDLTTKFVNGHYEIYKREEVLVIPEVAITAKVNMNEELVRGCEVYNNPGEHSWIYLDAAPGGIKLSQFMSLVSFTYGDGQEAETVIYNSNRDPKYQSYLANGSEVVCTAYDENGDPHETVYTVIMMGDVNKNGKVDTNDAMIIAKNYLGTADDAENIYNDEALRYAADMNRNDNATDSNDALQIVKKCMYWDATDGKRYVSTW